MVARDRNQDRSGEEADGKFTQIQEQLQKIMESMVGMNDRDAQTDKELVEIKQSLGQMKARDREGEN